MTTPPTLIFKENVVAEWARRSLIPMPAPGASGREVVEATAPFTAISAVALAASAAHAAAEVHGADYQVAAITAFCAFAIAVGLGFVTRTRLVERRHRHRVWAFLAVAASWATAAVFTGVTSGMLLTLTIIGLGLSTWWWKDHRLSNDWEPLDLPMPDATLITPVYADLWAQNLAGPNRPLQGSSLLHREILKSGERFSIKLVEGVQDVSTVQDLERKVRGGLRLRRADKVIIEEHPTMPAPWGQLTIINRSPVRDGVAWRREGALDPKTGMVQLGPYVDGEGTAQWKLYSANRIHNGTVAGGTGSGKSRLLENIAMAAADSKELPTVVWFLDGQNGQSSPLLAKHADLYAGSQEDIVSALREAATIIRVQGEENIADGAQGFTPTAQRPGTLIILDEAKLVLDKSNNPEHYEETQRLVALVATTGNKAGVGIILAGQEATLPTFGGSGQYPAAIRNNLQTANGVLLRTKEGAAGSIFGIKADLKSLPEGGGYGYIAGKEGSRHAMMRGFWQDDEATEALMESITWRTVGEVTRRELSAFYLKRKETSAANHEEIRRRVAARRAAAAAGEPIVARPQEPVRGSRITMRIPAPIPGTAGFAATEPFWVRPVKAGAVLNDSQLRVLKALQRGHTQWRAIATDAGLGRDQVFVRLNELKDLGLATKAGQGDWRPTEKAAQAA